MAERGSTNIVGCVVRLSEYKTKWVFFNAAVFTLAHFVKAVLKFGLSVRQEFPFFL